MCWMRKKDWVWTFEILFWIYDILSFITVFHSFREVQNINWDFLVIFKQYNNVEKKNVLKNWNLYKNVLQSAIIWIFKIVNAFK